MIVPLRILRLRPRKGVLVPIAFFFSLVVFVLLSTKLVFAQDHLLARANSLSQEARYLYEEGRIAEAIPIVREELALREQVYGPDHIDLARSLNNLAALLRANGDYGEAMVFLERALKIRVQVFGSNHPDVAMSLRNLALLLSTMGDKTGARPLLERALKIEEQVLGPSHPVVATTLNALAMLEGSGRAEARALHERALRIQEQSLGLDHLDTAATLYFLAFDRMAIDDYRGARELLERSLNIQEQGRGPDHPNVAVPLRALAFLLGLGGDYDAARLLYRRALRIEEKALGPTHPSLAMTLRGLARLDQEAGHPEDSQPKLARALAITRQYTSRGLAGLSNRQKHAFLEKVSPITEEFLSLPLNMVPHSEAYHAVLDRKNIFFLSLAAERVSTKTNSFPQVVSLLREYDAVRQQLAGLTLNISRSVQSQQYPVRIANLNERLEALEAALSRESAAFRQARLEASADPLDVCRSLPPDAALIDLYHYRRFVPQPVQGIPSSWTAHYVAFVLRGGDCRTPIRVDLGPAAPIDDEVKRFRSSVSRDATNTAARALRAQYRKTAAARLTARLFPQALREAIAGKPRLLIAPDGALALLPFALLPGEGGREFLVETRTISYIPSGRDLLRAQEKNAVAPSLLAIGAPAFDGASVQTARASTVRAGCGAVDEHFSSLPGTAAEVRAIATIARKAHPTEAVKILEHADATKAAFLEQAPRASVLHLATHAYFAGEECTPAGTVVTAPQQSFGEAPAFLGHNPLLLAGIALAGANARDKGDGILTALEITALDLRKTDLVVLSACDTGLGTLARGQELLGLRWAFAYAGAKNTVTSLWSVPDAETATMMGHFYENLWGKELSVSDALRAAQLEMLRAAREKGDSAPHTWGAFVASGQSQ
jgi:CHAT domain-containing protein/tetratricopeptide (TPR) repeat protein